LFAQSIVYVSLRGAGCAVRVATVAPGGTPGHAADSADSESAVFALWRLRRLSLWEIRRKNQRVSISMSQFLRLDALLYCNVKGMSVHEQHVELHEINLHELCMRTYAQATPPHTAQCSQIMCAAPHSIHCDTHTRNKARAHPRINPGRVHSPQRTIHTPYSQYSHDCAPGQE
jgi:hypothetical protein